MKTTFMTACFLVATLCCGCRTVRQPKEVLFSQRDLQRCESFAMASFTNDHTLLPTQVPGEPVFQIGGWRSPLITVYIPIRTPPNRLMFVYYTFRGLDEQLVKPSPFAIATRGNQEFMVTEFGMLTPDGYRVPMARRRGAPVVATPPERLGSRVDEPGRAPHFLPEL
jgi:hypothetical protein